MTHDAQVAGHPAKAERTITIDAEHFSVRFWGPVLTLTLVFIVHFGGQPVASRLLDDAISPLCLVLPADALVFFGGGMLIERWLKRLLPSRRSATLNEEALVVTDNRKAQPVTIRIQWHLTVNVTAWRFRVRRRTRVPKGWYCMALRLLQDEDEIILYTFMPPNEAEQATGYAKFVRLRPRKETQSNTDLRAVAEQRRLLKLEDARWSDGAEINPEDFHAVLAVLDQHVSDWA